MSAVHRKSLGYMPIHTGPEKIQITLCAVHRQKPWILTYPHSVSLYAVHGQKPWILAYPYSVSDVSSVHRKKPWILAYPHSFSKYLDQFVRCLQTETLDICLSTQLQWRLRSVCPMSTGRSLGYLPIHTASGKTQISLFAVQRQKPWILACPYNVSEDSDKFVRCPQEE